MIDTKAVLDLFKNIKCYNDLKALYNAAETAGFYLGSYWEAHNKHLAAIVRRNNPLGLEVPRFLSDPIQDDSNNYEMFEEKVKGYFGQFGIAAAIEQRLGNVSIDSKYSHYPKKKTRDEVIAMGFTPHADAQPNNAWYAYDFSNPLKLRFICNHFD